jgi:hypothetical protein
MMCAWWEADLRYVFEALLLIAGVSFHSSMLSLDVGILCGVAAFWFSLFFVRNMSGLAAGCKSASSGMSQFPCFLK